MAVLLLPFSPSNKNNGKINIDDHAYYNYNNVYFKVRGNLSNIAYFFF